MKQGAGKIRPREAGVSIGALLPGRLNAITDVEGVRVGHTTVRRGDSVHTGVTVVLPHGGNLFQEKVPGNIYVGNGFGKLAGMSQVQELGEIETPIVLTNTLAVPAACDALIEYTLAAAGNEGVRSVNPLVGETNDSELSDIRSRPVTRAHVLAAIAAATGGSVEEGNVGAGTGTVCFGYKGGIGTSSRQLPAGLGGYRVGVLVQSNFGGVLQIDGLPVGKLLGRVPFSEEKTIGGGGDGSCMMVVATDAPLDARQLHRVAKRAFLGLGRTGGIAAHGSGDYVVAFSTAAEVRIPHQGKDATRQRTILEDDRLSPLFMAAIEATEEAIISSLFAADTVIGHEGKKVEALPLERVLPLLSAYQRVRL